MGIFYVGRTHCRTDVTEYLVHNGKYYYKQRDNVLFLLNLGVSYMNTCFITGLTKELIMEVVIIYLTNVIINNKWTK